VLAEPSPALLAQARFVADEQRTAVAVMGGSCPEELSRLGATAQPGARDAVRTVLLAYAGLGG